MERKQDEKWDGGGCSGTCKAGEKIPIPVSRNILFRRTFTLTWTRDLGFKFFGGGRGFMLVSQIAL